MSAKLGEILRNISLISGSTQESEGNQENHETTQENRGNYSGK